jgi:phage terminase large subunit GpA-like protein
MNSLLLDPLGQAAELTRYCYDLLTPPPKLLVWEWCERNVYMSEREGATSGQYSTRLTPYVREPLQAYADRSITDLALCWGTQVAKTTVVMMGTAYKLVNDPMNAVWVMPVKDLARSFSKNRWMPLVDNCPPLAEQKPLNPTGTLNKHLFGFMEQQFSRATLNFVGSNSASQLASRPAGLLNMDEIDKFDLEDEREAGALQNAEERTKTFPFPLRVKTSTPTTVHGEIWREFLLGDQRYYHVPCPCCQKEIVFKFQVKSEVHGDCGIRWWRESEDEVKTDGVWDYAKVRDNAFYRCQECGGAIRDNKKQEMLLAGRWVVTNPNSQPGRRSYHLNSIYSLLGRECTFGAIAVKWLQTKGSMSKRHAFINSTLAETWDDEKAVDDNPVFLEDYEETDLPPERTPILTVDVQEGHFWAGVRTWAPFSAEKPNGESWLQYYDRVESIEEIEELEAHYQVEPKNVVFDMAHKPNTVAKWIVEHNWRGMWGSDKNGFIHTQGNGARLIKLHSPVNSRDPQLGTAFQSEGNDHAMFVYWANAPIKDMLMVLRFSEPTCWHIHANVISQYQRQINAERVVAERQHRTGRTVYRWKQLRRDNHALDVECMSLVRAMQLGLVPAPEETPAAVQRVLQFHAAGEN